MPMSVYVLVSILLSAYTLHLATGDLGTPKGCSSNFLYMLMGMAVLNIAFAIYFQCTLWGRIMSDENKEKFEIVDEDAKGSYAAAGKKGLASMAANIRGGPAAEEAPAPGPAPGSTYKERIPAEVITDSFVHVILYDPVVLIAFLALCGTFIVCFMGPKTLDGEKGCKVGERTKDMGYAFFWVAFLWSFTYRYCGCCSRSVTLVREPETRLDE